ncbi:unnamed protein product [Moneuplotes crassus]|uniref:Uncharacterized protein n=1 Tax=Euplotes crassus TaxID=5936 RepID=A0AAD1U3U7_EUPCR|nr:unnamed protein product [Moneuplotes crassus]
MKKETYSDNYNMYGRNAYNLEFQNFQTEDRPSDYLPNNHESSDNSSAMISPDFGRNMQPEHDVTSRASQKSSKSLHKSINLMELQKIATNRSKEARSAAFNQYSEPYNSTNMRPISEDSCEENVSPQKERGSHAGSGQSLEEEYKHTLHRTNSRKFDYYEDESSNDYQKGNEDICSENINDREDGFNPSEEFSENISDDSDTQECSMKKFNINQINLNKGPYMDDSKKTPSKQKNTHRIESSSKKEIIEFQADTTTKRISNNFSKSLNKDLNHSSNEENLEDSNTLEREEIKRESAVVDGFEESEDTIIKNLQYEPSEEESGHFEPQLVESEKESHIQTYMPPKSLQETEEFEWQETQQNIFPPNLTGTEDMEEIIQMEEQDLDNDVILASEGNISEEEIIKSESSQQKVDDTPITREEEEKDIQEIDYNPFPDSSRRHTEILNKILDSEKNQQPSGDNFGLSSQQETIINQKKSSSNADDTVINLRSIDNPLHQMSLIEKENQDSNQFDKVIMFSPFRDSQISDPLLMPDLSDPVPYDYVYHDRNEEPHEDFTLMKSNPSPADMNPQGKSSPSVPERDSPDQKLTQCKTKRIEYLIDCMYCMLK